MSSKKSIQLLKSALLSGVILAASTLPIATASASPSGATKVADTIVIERDHGRGDNFRYRRRGRGHYEHRRMILRPGHYETYRIWVPREYDRGWRVRVRGHFELRQRWVPDVFGDKEIWIEER